MSLIEKLKRNVPYDPFNAHVPGVDEEQRRQIIKEYVSGGDPVPKLELLKERIVFNFAGIKLVRFE